MTCYAVIDTNILVSALLSSHDQAATVQIVSRMLAGEIIPVFSAEIMQEYREVLRRKKFQFSREMVDYLLASVNKFGVFVNPEPKGIVLPDIKDVPFYEVVLEKQDDNAYLVTGNIKHFPKVPYIVTARQLIDILDRENK
ncbi:MAG: putative toxin-antitoxin system toxin component, PIN family [Lachnospiraceae bacterium]|nr:putative toxin-antitoxin system toxin component, PIN family [Lachnospiraceae bacterium]